jgi:hypothetical protein
LKTKGNKPIPTNIMKIKTKAKMKPRKRKNQKMIERPLYPNKRRNLKEANLEDLQERANQCQDVSLA